MSVELYSASRNNESLHSTTVGGSKPLHRFIKGQPKVIGVVVLVLGSSFFIISVAVMRISFQFIQTVMPPGFLLGILFIISGILYILTEHSPTKKTVTISLALSIVTLLGTFWTILTIMFPSDIGQREDFPHFVLYDNNTEDEGVAWIAFKAMGESMELIYLIHSIVGAIIFIVMSTLAGAALRSTKSQALVVMTTPPTETQVEERAQEEVQ